MILWFFVTLNREYEVQINAPVLVKKLVANNQNLILSKDSISIRLKARGFAILRGKAPLAKIIVDASRVKSLPAEVDAKNIKLILNESIKKGAIVINYDPPNSIKIFSKETQK